MTKVTDLHQKWLADPDYQDVYEAQRIEFEGASDVIAARKQGVLSQAELAESIRRSPHHEP